MTHYFTSESVTCGHPDKVCDRIADEILDALLKSDPHARSACEVTCTAGLVHLFGEISSAARVDYGDIARGAIAAIGYTQPGQGFDADSCRITADIHGQSPDIAMGIDRRAEDEVLNGGAGDQGTVCGYACGETDSLMPLPIELAHSLAKRLEQVRRAEELPYLLPDGKTQVTVEYEGDIPRRIATVLVSAQHRRDRAVSRVREDILRHVILPTLPGELTDDNTQFYINPTGRFVLGGPAADAGLTGRKTAVDTYGGRTRWGGGSLSGKDGTKTDRSGAYMARYLAKNIVAAGLARRCEVQLSYAIGLAEPVALDIDTFGTGTVPEDSIRRAVEALADLRPFAIIRKFRLTEPRFARISCYGHFGRNAQGQPWESTDLAAALRDSAIGFHP